MGYLHIENLYKNQDILLFKECYSLEKVHGTSAHITWNNGLGFFSGGEKYDNFIKLFNKEDLENKFKEIFADSSKVIIYGEAYGGKQQGMKDTYGPNLSFIVFDIKVNDSWLDVPKMDDLATRLGLEVVPWKKVSTNVSVLDAERDAPSEVAVRRGITEPKIREGVVIRPITEVIKNNGNRIIAKHKRIEFSERKTSPKVVDSAKLQILKDALAIAEEWCTAMRLEHVLQKLPLDIDIKSMRTVLDAMYEDISREANGEIIESQEARAAINRQTATLFKRRLNKVLNENTINE
jgi:RNA ligase